MILFIPEDRTFCSAQKLTGDNLSYPRPDFQRNSLQWHSLNGEWDFYFDDGDVGEKQEWHRSGIPAASKLQDPVKRKITVPFVFQSDASGINEQGVHEVLWYERAIEDIRTNEQIQSGYRLVLRFGAVDYIAKVWIDGCCVDQHRGGHTPFECDITDVLSAARAKDQRHSLTVRVFDSAIDLTQPRGKQYWGPKPQDIYYTPSSGIWQNVWLESVPSLRIAYSSDGTVLRSNDIKGGCLDARVAVIGRSSGAACSVQIEAKLGYVSVTTSTRIYLPRGTDFVRFRLAMHVSPDKQNDLPDALLRDSPLTNGDVWRNGVALWSPEHPIIYDLIIRLYNSDDQLIDLVNTTIGMRSFKWSNGDETFRLNGKPYFQALLLDQGYWPENLMTPPSHKALKGDIELAKAMGFNGVRKHQKVEDPVFLYWADRLGFLVWGEMASAYQFSVEYVERFDQEWTERVKRDINHPCIVAWTIANESWGYPNLSDQPRQRDHIRSLYYTTKTLDPTRPINDNCGWEHVVTDLTTFHDYADAGGMEKRCASIQSVVERVSDSHRPLFLQPTYGAIHDGGSQHSPGAPIICTELGGVNISTTQDNDHQENWGYTTAKDCKDLLQRVENIIMATVKRGVVCGFVWTQLTDIEQEQNGLYTYDRKPKVPPEEMRVIIGKVREAYYEARKACL